MSRDELVGEQAERIAAQDRQITALATRIADMDEAYEALAAKLARVEHLLSRNSGNSSSPPSMDDQPGKPAPQARSSRDRPGRVDVTQLVNERRRHSPRALDRPLRNPSGHLPII